MAHLLDCAQQLSFVLKKHFPLVWCHVDVIAAVDTIRCSLPAPQSTSTYGFAGPLPVSRSQGVDDKHRLVVSQGRACQAAESLIDQLVHLHVVDSTFGKIFAVLY